MNWYLGRSSSNGSPKNEDLGGIEVDAVRDRFSGGEPVQTGDVFSIELREDFSVIAQVLSYEADAMGSYLCAFTMVPLHKESQSADLDQSDVISVQFVTADSFRMPEWRRITSAPVLPIEGFLDLQAAREVGFIGTEIFGGRNVTKFLCACFGLRAWDDWANPNYLDSMLLSGAPRPPLARMKSDFERLPS